MAENEGVLAGAVPTFTKVELSVERWTSNPVSLEELSVHERVIAELLREAGLG